MRLMNIQVDEVSLVDKAANKRKFAFMKRDDSKEVVKAEAAQAQAVIDKDKNKDEFTPEELELLQKLHTEIIELAAQVKKS